MSYTSSEVSDSAPKTRISAGSVWSTSNPDFQAGSLRPASGEYRNQQTLLELLPAAPEGYSWRLKAYRNRSKAEHAPEWDICFELEANQRN